MRNLSYVLLAGILALVMFAGSGLAAVPTGWTQEPEAVLNVYMPDPSGEGQPTVATDAKVFRLLPGYSEECNQDHEFPFHVQAQIAQWARVDINFTGWSWYVRKPGTYFADSIEATIASNGPVTIVLDGFGDLYNEDNQIRPTIATSFAYAVALEGDDGYETFLADQHEAWIAADAVNGSINIPDSKALHHGLTWKLWNKIVVEPSNSAGLYEMGEATISVTLDNFSDWAQDDLWDDDTYFHPNNG